MAYSKQNFKKGEILHADDLNAMDTQIAKNESDIIDVRSIAEGRDRAFVFNTLADMLNFIGSENVSKLHIGDNLYIKATDVPDYWWDGETAQVLESDKQDLTNFVTQDELDTIKEDLANKYTKPSSGIPKSDFASAVQSSLGKADTALQSVPDAYATKQWVQEQGYGQGGSGDALTAEQKSSIQPFIRELAISMGDIGRNWYSAFCTAWGLDYDIDNPNETPSVPDTPSTPDEPIGQPVSLTWSGTTARFTNIQGTNVTWSGTTAKIGG